MGVKEKKIRVFLYIRTSTIDQKNGIANQEEQLKEHCTLNRYEIIDIFRDHGKSGKNTDRPEFQRMFRLIRSTSPAQVDLVLCTKLDRFARSLIDLNTQVMTLFEYGVGFSTLQMTFDLSTPTGKLMFDVMGAFAEFERGLINERTREGYEAAKRRGVVCNRPKIALPKNKILEYITVKNLSASAVAKIYGTTAGTIKNRLNEWGYYYEAGEWKKED